MLLVTTSVELANAKVKEQAPCDSIVELVLVQVLLEAGPQGLLAQAVLQHVDDRGALVVGIYRR